MGKYEEVKDLTESIKNIFVIILYVAATIFIIFWGIPFIKGQLTDPSAKWEMHEVEFAGLKFLRVSNAVNTPARTENTKPNDIKVDVASIPAVSYLDSLANKNQDTAQKCWVYVGQFEKGGNWLTKNFSFGNSYSNAKSLVDVYKRETLPVHIKGDEWQLGKIIGIVYKGESVKILDADTDVYNNIWAKLYWK